MAVNKGATGPSWSTLAFGAAFAAGLFAALFADRRPGLLDFWTRMTLSVAFLCLFALLSDRGLTAGLRTDVRTRLFHKMAFGLLSAAGLYGFFAAGRFLSVRLLAFAARDIGSVYLLKEGAGALRVGLLLAFLIGPGEELFWRGFLQAGIANRIGGPRALVLTSLFYALVHAATGNAMLVLAALAGGLFWGCLFLRTKSVILTAVSHAAWDVAVFVILPFT